MLSSVRTWVAVAALTVFLCACGQAARVRIDARPAAAVWDVRRTVHYGPDAAEVLDLYTPPGGRGRPVILYLHSGGWIAGTRAQVPAEVLSTARDLGMAVASADYRLATPRTDHFPASPEDVDRAIRWLKATSQEWGLDPGRVIVAGESAGGHLAALAGAAPGRFADPTLPAPLRSVDPRVAGVIDVVGPSDLAAFVRAGGWAPGMTEQFLGCSGPCPPSRLAAAGVAPYLGPGAPPAFLAYGDKDTLVVPATQGQPLATAWTRARGSSGVVYDEDPNGDHNSVQLRGLRLWLLGVVSGAWR